MKKTNSFLLMFIIVMITNISLSANPKANLVDRKKNFDSKAKSLLSMQEILTSEKLSKDKETLKDMISEVDSTYRSGEKDKIKKTLSLGELKLAAFQKDYTTFIGTETKELMENYSSQLTAAEEKESDKKSKPTLTHTATKEKSSEYYTIAKSDYSNAVKFERDGNLQYSIQLYKRALNYTVLAFEKSKLQLPAKFANLSKSLGTEVESEVSPVEGTHKSQAKETKESKPIKSIK
ncbi:MAG: hypothetical protein IPL26_14720 [Leptospiraceae bacterium]|nr:hypothetical protein [Leptospiraceae bacterium]